MIPVITALIPVLNKVLDFIPDPQKKAEAQLKMQEELNRHQEAILQALASVDVEQAKINQADAASLDKYRSYARPTAMWACVLGIVWEILAVIVTQFYSWSGATIPVIVHLPEFVLNTLMYGLLGLTAARSVDLYNEARK